MSKAKVTCKLICYVAFLLSYKGEKDFKIMLDHKQICDLFNQAIEEGQYIAYFQPQYNQSAETMIGAEALVRWKHPEEGLVAPGDFIPALESCGLISKLDLYVFEYTCRFIRECMNGDVAVVPISTNFSRYGIFQDNFVERLEQIREKYDVPVHLLRIEITESVAIKGEENVNDVVRRLHHYGYIVEMDDFGSGYSSLNVLKDVDFDIIKLDMKFLSSQSKRGGIILSSIVRMGHWLNLPIIAEGVETIEQRDFLRSIGCDYIQGYLYSKPLSATQFVELLKRDRLEQNVQTVQLVENLDLCELWNPDTIDTMMFSYYVGAAAIFEYVDDKINILRINQKYVKELGMNLSEKEIMEFNPKSQLDPENWKIYTTMLVDAVRTGQEQECETWRCIQSDCCGVEHLCIRSTVRMIGKSKGQYLFYGMIRNITMEKQVLDNYVNTERRFKAASEQANIYYWEYDIATREMRPCFRCMRDLGLPVLLKNYPEPAIEMGIFPSDVADQYREMHRQLEQGAEQLEAIMPLTADRVPFHVRYTTEFDATGKPIKAYGSATLVVDGKQEK